MKNSNKLLPRDKFKDMVFTRDKYICVVCTAKAVDAHHLLERKLWKDGGYYLDNGVSLCAKCHLAAEKTDFTVVRLRQLAKITNIIVPEGLNPELCYDKWGNEIDCDGNLVPGPLAQSAAVQKIMTHKLHLFLIEVCAQKLPKPPKFLSISKDIYLQALTFSYSNLKGLFNYANDKDYFAYCSFAPYHKLDDGVYFLDYATSEWKSENGCNFIYGIYHKGELCGTIDLRYNLTFKESENPLRPATLGYNVCKNMAGKGIATQASRRLIEWAFNNTPYDKFEMMHRRENFASAKVMKKLGFNPTDKKAMLKNYAGLEFEVIVEELSRDSFIASL